MYSLRGFLHGIEHVTFHGHLDYSQKPPLGGKPNTKPGDRGTPNAHNRWFILFYHGWGPAWIEIHWNSIWLTAQSHMTSHYTWGPVTTLHDVGGVLGRPLDTFSWALTIPWSRLLARVWSGPKCTHGCVRTRTLQLGARKLIAHERSTSCLFYSVHKIFRAYSIETLVFPSPIGSMLWSLGFFKRFWGTP